MPLNNLSFLPGKVTCLSQNKDPLETYDRKLSDVVFCLEFVIVLKLNQLVFLQYIGAGCGARMCRGPTF